MSAFLHPKATTESTYRSVREPGELRRPQPPAYRIDWYAARRAQHACCCPAKPAVIAVMPPVADRPHYTELLFCAHHYRVSRRSLESAGAVLLGIDGGPVAVGVDWPIPAQA